MAEKCTQVVLRRVASPRIVKRAAPSFGVGRFVSTGGLKVTQETMSAINTEQSKSAERTTMPLFGSQITTVKGKTTLPVGSQSKAAEETTPSLEKKIRVARETTPIQQSKTPQGTTSIGSTSKGPSQRKEAKRTRPVPIRREGSRRKEWAWEGFEKRGKPFHIVRHSDVTPSPAEVTSSAGFEVLCSYSWQRGTKPTIQVPGRPRVWQDHELPLQLSPDKGRFYIDQNRARMHDRPMESLLRAAECLDAGAEDHETTKLDDIHVISTGNSLRKLLAFVSGGKQNAPFRLDFSIIQDTLIIERCEMKYVENCNGGEESGWGRSFETAFTAAAEGQKDAGYFRALRYPLGDLNCVVLNEVDASIDQTSGQHLPPPPPPPPSEVTTINTRPMIIEVAGDRSGIMSQSSLAEIKSQMSNSWTRPGTYVPQVWFARLPWLIIGRHKKGNFHQVRKIETEPRFAEWEEQKQTDLRKLVTLLHELREVMRRTQRPNCCALFARGSGGVWPDRDRKRSVISEDMMQRFWTRP